MKQSKTFYRHYETKGWPLYWLLLGYIVAGWFWPIVGWALLFYIIGTVVTAFWRGRWWCGHVCPRGNMYMRLLSRYSPHRQIPPFVGIRVDERCEATCQTCARVCPMQLKPYESRGKTEGYLHSDCFKCGKCAKACPHHAVGMRTYSYLPK